VGRLPPRRPCLRQVAAVHQRPAGLAKRPQIKAIVYFDTKNDAFGDRDISIDSSATSLTAFRKLAANPLFDVKLN
jgi:hypothetical protein